jgi:predicted hydrocarbon binding protein
MDEEKMRKMEELKGRMAILAILSNALELLSGDWARTICFIAGKKLGENSDVENSSSIEEAIKNVEPWKIEIFENKEDGQLIVFKECPIRQTHYAVCTNQGGPLCQVTHGYFAQIFSKAIGKDVKIELIHAGPNACLKRVVVE